MARRNIAVLSRGRLQAQGDGLEKSRPWAEANVPTKQNGHTFVGELKGQLTPAELTIRENCFEKAEQWVDEAPQTGYVVVTPIKTSFQPYPPVRDVRVDGELYSGAAFKD